MRIELAKSKGKDERDLVIRQDAVLVTVFEGEDPLAPLNGILSEGVKAAVQRRFTVTEFAGKDDQVVQIHPAEEKSGKSGKNLPSTLVWVGLGKKEEFSEEKMLILGARMVRLLRSLGAKSGAVLFPTVNDATRAKLVRLVTNGALRGAYAFDRYLSKKEKNTPAKLVFMFETIASKVRLGEALRFGTVTAEAANVIRDLINEPPSEMNPGSMAKAVKKLFAGTSVRVQVFDQKWLTKNRMNAHLAVGRGGANPPCLVKLTYKGNAKANKNTTLVGKGITFDSGGLSIKPANSMTTMKGDMGGAATVTGIIMALSKLKAKVNVTGYLGLAENMLGSKAYKPGDVLKARNGKTIEIHNTDAEGRLVLADVLCLASEDEPDRILDFATLTGACMVALGPDLAGLFSDDEEIVKGIEEATSENGEPLWRLPLVNQYRKTLKSPVADLKNIGGRYGGAITAALFLQEFVDKEIPWAHIDIAGPAFAEKSDGENPLGLKGGTGVYVASITDYLMNH